MSLKIFFSHAWADKAGANLKMLMNALKESADQETWIDRYEMDLSDDIDSSIENSIKECDSVVVAWSENSSTNKNVEFELTVAKKYKKPIIPCIIDGCPTDKSPLVKGLKWMEITGDKKHDVPQLAFLKDYLIKLRLNKIETSASNKKVKKQTADLKKKQTATSNLLKELEDIHYRQKKGASGNEASDIYVQSALKEAINLTASDSKEKINEFFKRMMQATTMFPGKENDQKKVEYLLQTLMDLDPDRSDAEFQKFCEGALSTFGVIFPTTEESAASKNTQAEEKKENDEAAERPSGNFYDNGWFGVRLYLNDGQIQENYANGCKVHFPDIGTANIYFYYNFHDNVNAIAEYLNRCINNLRNQGTEVHTGDDFDVGDASIAVEMAYYNKDGVAQYEYFGGYYLESLRGFMMEIVTNDETVTTLFRQLFEKNAYLLNTQEPGEKTDQKLFNQLANRKLLSLSSSSSGYGNFYSNSSDQKHFKLFENGVFNYYYRATNYSSGLGSVNNESSGSGLWGVYTENSQQYMWFKWNEGQYEVCELRFGSDGDLYLGDAKYFIVSHDYRV